MRKLQAALLATTTMAVGAFGYSQCPAEAPRSRAPHVAEAPEQRTARYLGFMSVSVGPNFPGERWINIRIPNCDLVVDDKGGESPFFGKPDPIFSETSIDGENLRDAHLRQALVDIAQSPDVDLVIVADDPNGYRGDPGGSDIMLRAPYNNDHSTDENVVATLATVLNSPLIDIIPCDTTTP